VEFLAVDCGGGEMNQAADWAMVLMLVALVVFSCWMVSNNDKQLKGEQEWVARQRILATECRQRGGVPVPQVDGEQLCAARLEK
jgi:hypothetical protein